MDVLFAVMPFADLQAPAIGVSLLKAGVEERGFSGRIKYYSFELGEALGPDLYNAIAGYGDYTGVANAPPTETLLGEWFFAEQVFGNDLPPASEYLGEFIERDAQLGPLIPELVEARGRTAAWVDRWAEDILAQGARVVGFTSSFYQTCACLAVAKRLKEDANPPFVVFGGANCAGAMGAQLSRSFPFIDFVCAGEGDEVFPALLDRLLRERPTDGVRRATTLPGIVGQDDEGPSEAPLVTRMDSLPIPDYTEFFDQLGQTTYADRIAPRLLVETARGCWWGAKHHCTFCGLNAETMSFRAKSADRALEEILYLSATHGIRQIDCVDNILHMPYLRTLLPRLIDSEAALELFFETKANLKREQLATLKRGGVWCVQPGIESFSDEVLELMRKGCTGLQNIQVLRWCAELGIEVIWNIIFGFPGEPEDEYERMAELVPLLTHLRRPTFAVRVRLDRFSPYFVDPESFGLRNPRPAPAYRHVFAVEPEEALELAYFFDFDYEDGRDPFAYTRRLRENVARWAEANALPVSDRPRLDLFETAGMALVKDSRECAAKPLHVLDGVEKEVYLLCDTARSLPAICRELGQYPPPSIEAALDRLVQCRLMAALGGRYLSLAVFRTRRSEGEGRVAVAAGQVEPSRG